MNSPESSFACPVFLLRLPTVYIALVPVWSWNGDGLGREMGLGMEIRGSGEGQGRGEVRGMGGGDNGWGSDLCNITERMRIMGQPRSLILISIVTAYATSYVY